MSVAISGLWQIGINENLPRYLKHKIKLTNQISIAIALLAAILFTFQTQITGANLLVLKLLPLAGIVVCLLILFLNYYRAHFISRILLALLPIPILIVYHSYLTSVGSPPLASVFMIQTGFALMAFVIFDLKEWPYMIIIAIINYVSFLSFDYANELFEIVEQQETITNGLAGKLAIIIGLSIVFTIAIILLKINESSEEQTLVLKQEVKEGQQKLAKSERELKAYIEKTEEAQELEKLRIWESEGIAKFGTLLRTHGNSAEIYDIVISELVKYMEVNQGGLYLVKEENSEQYIELAGCYAFDRKKYLHQKVKIGEGLIGQAYLEKLPTYMEDLPDNYVNIRSGLGDAAPGAIIIMPLLHNENVEGILEMASFKPPESYQVSFLEKLSTNIASWISTHRINEQTKKLYENSQAHTQKMQEQEEEMRQNMEELAATQEDMKRKEEELKVLLKASQDQLVHQNLAEIKVQIENDLEGAKRELSFLINVPPIEGIFRAFDNNGVDPSDNCTADIWIERFAKIIQGLLKYKNIYGGIHFYTDKHIISMVGSAGSLKTTRLGSTTKSGEALNQKILSGKPGEIFVGEPAKHGAFSFLIAMGLPITYQEKQRGILIIDLLGDALVDKIKSKENEETGFHVKNSKHNTLYQGQDSSGFKETDLSMQIILNEKNSYKLLISHLSSN